MPRGVVYPQRVIDLGDPDKGQQDGHDRHRPGPGGNHHNNGDSGRIDASGGRGTYRPRHPAPGQNEVQPGSRPKSEWSPTLRQYYYTVPGPDGRSYHILQDGRRLLADEPRNMPSNPAVSTTTGTASCLYSRLQDLSIDPNGEVDDDDEDNDDGEEDEDDDGGEDDDAGEDAEDDDYRSGPQTGISITEWMADARSMRDAHATLLQQGASSRKALKTLVQRYQAARHVPPEKAYEIARMAGLLQ